MLVFRQPALLRSCQKTIILLESRLATGSATTTGSYMTDEAHSFKFSDLELRTSKNWAVKPDVKSLAFGRHFSDHMLEIPWSESKGWGVPTIGPLRKLEIHPAAKVLHYALEIFEGLKAYYGVDGKIRLFRPELNMERMLTSTKRTCLPEFDGSELLRCIAQLIDVDRDWVPQERGSSLYVRPTLIGTEPSITINRSKEALLYVIIGPVGPYFSTGMKPISLLADPRFIRSWPGGAGDFKMGSNYASTVAVQKEAEKLGCQQVLWLFGTDHRLTEVGTMNIFVFWVNENGDKELVTPPLDGLILPGVTRKSLLDLARKWGEFKVSERSISMKDIVKASRDNRIIELFGAGTACVVCPIASILYQGQNIKLPVGDFLQKQMVSQRFYTELLDIQYGRAGKHPWVVDINELIAHSEDFNGAKLGKICVNQ